MGLSCELDFGPHGGCLPFGVLFLWGFNLRFRVVSAMPLALHIERTTNCVGKKVHVSTKEALFDGVFDDEGSNFSLEKWVSSSTTCVVFV